MSHPTFSPPQVPRQTSRTVAAIATCVLIAACGSTSPNSSSSSSSSSSYRSVGHPNQAQVQDEVQHELLDFARCMRGHRVPRFPDPTSPAATKEFVLGQVPGINTHSPAFESADTACKHLLPGGGSSSPGAAAQAMTQLLHTSRCMRAHGLPGFPDPTTTRPADQAAYLAIVGLSANNAPPGAPPVAYLAIPNSIDPSSPAARRAAAACHFRLS
ncbi:MAG: hypothetical protein ACRDLV_12220 [Solirubrobacteraceae bacterium]